MKHEGCWRSTILHRLVPMFHTILQLKRSFLGVSTRATFPDMVTFALLVLTLPHFQLLQINAAPLGSITMHSEERAGSPALTHQLSDAPHWSDEGRERQPTFLPREAASQCMANCTLSPAHGKDSWQSSMI